MGDKCFYCGNDQSLAAIAKATGFRPDVAYVRIQELEAEIESSKQEDIASCNKANSVIKRLRQQLAESVPKSEIENILANNVTSSDIAEELRELLRESCQCLKNK